MQQTMPGGSILGAAVTRAEDPRLIRGEGSYLTNQTRDDQVWMVPVRSQVAHGTMTGVDADHARVMPGVVGVFTAEDIIGLMLADFGGQTDETRLPLISGPRVRFVGDIVAVVVAETEIQAIDAAEAVWVDIDPLPAVATVEAALAPDAPKLYDGLDGNVVDRGGLNADTDPLGGAHTVVKLRVVHPRVAAVPLETNGAMAWREDDRLEVIAGTQNALAHRSAIAHAIGLDRNELRVRVPDMGGGFGAKIPTYREQALVTELARRLGRTVRWQERRTENMVSMTHGRAQVHDVEMGADAEGRIVGVRISAIQDVGAYPLFATHLPRFTQRMAAGPYDIPAIEFSWRSVVTNTTPVHAYRGAGRPEATMSLERAIDVLADELGIDPVEIRRRNFYAAFSFPLETATGERYDSGAYEAALDLVTTAVGYDQLRLEQERRRMAGERWQLGVGVASYVEVTAPGGRKDWGSVEILEDGSAVVWSGASSHGQGHETTFPQIVSAVLGIAREDIRFVQGDTDVIARGGGTMGSRSLQMAGSAVLISSRAILDRARHLVSRQLEASVDDIVVLDDGSIGVAGVPESGFEWSQIVALATAENDGAGLRHAETYEQAHPTVPFGSHVSVVEVDTEIGDIRLLRHVTCDDCGTILNRMIVDGQVHGGVAQGIGTALFEHVRYDQDGNPLTTNLTSYLIPTAVVMPDIEVHHTETPTSENPLGVKGIGEAGTIGSAPAVVNAVIDAVSHLGVTHLDMPITAERVWAALARGS